MSARLEPYRWHFVQVCVSNVIAFLTSSVDVDCMSQALSSPFTDNSLPPLSSTGAENNRDFNVTKEETKKENKKRQRVRAKKYMIDTQQRIKKGQTVNWCVVLTGAHFGMHPSLSLSGFDTWRIYREIILLTLFEDLKSRWLRHYFIHQSHNISADRPRIVI